MTRRIEIPNLDDIIKRYQSGVPLQRLSKETGYTRTVLSKRLIEAGIKIRSYSDGQRARWRDFKSPEYIEKTLGAAWKASRGRVPSIETRHAIAKTRFHRQLFRFKGEDRIAAFLELSEFPVVQQFPVGPYNLDITLYGFSIAIEVVHLSATDFNFPRSGPQGKERLKYLLDRGWFVLYLIATGTRENRTNSLRTIGHDLIAWVEHACCNESLRGHYWVIWGHGDPPPRAKYDFGKCSLVPRALRPAKPTLH
jgi:hypothetical protein